MIPFILAGIMLYGPYAWCFMRKEPTEEYGLSWTLDIRGLKDSLLAIAVTLTPLTPFAMMWPDNDLPRSLPLTTVLVLLTAGAVAAVVEEVFFRGWIQTLLSKRTNRNISIVATALLFALAHLFLKLHWLRFATFFPGLVMGILRERHRSVAPSAIYHFAGNIWSIWFFPDIPI
ncbi:SYNERG-CTERM system CAAX-type protease [Dethiosulfovibrio sp. F2B]|uniref:Synerg-CTERM system glutamic-type intramembrane protease MrtS n=1 Tax=Dethiosulfovibrio faecalis TaxID=2720018 RepID=UPI001EEB61DA|nr:SYNERG-CTERM system CAAX-type protease [Dethiosulfovibrio faecalis]